MNGASRGKKNVEKKKGRKIPAECMCCSLSRRPHRRKKEIRREGEKRRV